MNKILLYILIFIPTLNFAQSDHLAPEFTTPPPFLGAKGKVKSYTIKTWERDKGSGKVSSHKNPVYTETYYFNKKGMIDSTHAVNSPDYTIYIYKTYYREQIEPYRLIVSEVIGKDTIVTDISENTYTRLGENQIIRKTINTQPKLKKVEIKTDTTLIDHKNQSVQFSPFPSGKKGVYTIFYKNHQMLKTIHQLENGNTLIMEYFYKDSLVDKVRYYMNNKFTKEERNVYTLFDKKGNWIEKYTTSNEIENFSRTERTIVYEN
ncbi:hypothetical protein [Chryseobacterium sp.]|mgnify:CR=1 FL=1|uniref:hypothetical protein n=1 Tax=Chryseobacterium sp. TaxID=1871047 RepID=UPI0025C682E5|nr:hypothetical protein [Chryseobacterium sp.]